ncbi:receptor-like protein EIX2 [Gossypium hirsutum]|uniref:Receptor-like protein EIX2 n=1 Tax=Gossypium hirsutum TaxID=3635 RepID=A0A1U8IB17_GOSHI|nr:receptor-like protein EIX2 [Gossypium hirsutum]
MTSLRLLDLSGNQFSGYFPFLIISNLTNIESLFLSSNELQGMISLCVFANLSRLSELDISFNHLEVETEMMSPSCFPSFKLSTLSLGGCNVKKISPWMLHNITSELWLSGNNLTGLFSSNFQNITSKLTLVDISDNFLHGTLPEDINLNFPEPRHLGLSNNSFNGNLPIFFSELLQMLDLSDNQFHGGIPHGMTSNMSCLLYLRLFGNNLTGDLFPKNSSLPNLRGLYLNNKHLSETFPYALSKSMELGIIDIRNNDLSGELSSYLPVLPKLKVLVLDRNRFEGKILMQICQMRDLSILDLSKNDLSGDMPDYVGNVTSWNSDTSLFLNGIDVSCNRLTGKIPIQMTRLKGINFLNVSNNLLTGQIPSSLGNMTILESLDLSHNNLSGVLPQELVGILSLEVFDVSFNNLSGMIPIGEQFGTFEDDSYLGNPRLCGLPLKIKCNDSVETSPIYSTAEKSVSIMDDDPHPKSDWNTKKVKFNDNLVEEDITMDGDLNPKPIMSWKDKLLRGLTVESASDRTVITEGSDNDFELLEGDVNTTIIDGVPAITFSDRMKDILFKEIELMVTVKLLGRNIGYNALHNCILSLWNPAVEDYNRVLSQSLWIVYGQYLTVQPWTKHFSPSQSYLSMVLAWIRLPNLTGYIYKRKIIEAIRGLIRKVITDGVVQRVEYEALPTVCFACGKYEHVKETCPTVVTNQSLAVPQGKSSIGVDVSNRGKSDNDSTVSKNRKKELEFGP